MTPERVKDLWVKWCEGERNYMAFALAIAREARREERERCARVCEQHDRECENGHDCAWACAQALRALPDEDMP